MAKQIKKETIHKTSAKKEPVRGQQPRQTSFSVDFIPQKYQTPVFLAVILIAILIFFNQGLFGGKVFTSADNIASESFKTFLDDAKKDGIFPLWVPYIFNGMPSFAALVPHLERMYDISHAVWVSLRDILYALFSGNSVWAVVLFYIIFGFSFYFLAEYKFKDKLIALFAALAAVFVTPIIQMIIVGHNSKMIAVMMFPAVFLMLEKIYDMLLEGKIKERIFRLLLYFGLLIFFLHIQMSSNHVQMLFYFFSMIGAYLVYRLVYNIIKKQNTSAAAIVFVVFIAAAGISALMYADSYLSSTEYNKYSIRGVPPITETEAEKQKVSGAADYEYSTNWSFSPVEVMTFFVPYWVGFGDVEYKNQMTNTYWGQMPFTTSPMYFGVITLLLGFIGIYYNFRKSAVVQVMVIVSFVSLILSFGRTFPIFYDILFYHLPYFSSFRAPVMIHILINVAFVILAGYGIKSIIEIAKDKGASARLMASAKYVFPILALPVIFSVIGFEGYYTSQVASSPLIQKLQAQGANQQQINQYVKQVTEIAYSNVKSEMLVIGLLLLAAYAVIHYFIKGNIKYQVFGFALILFMLIDLWHIDFKTLNWSSKTDTESYFKTPDWVSWLLQNDKNTYEYRVLNLQNGQPVRENTLAYWHLHNIYGYQGAKLRIYQDMDDVVGLGNPHAWELMNTKYIISDKEFGDSVFATVFKGSKIIMMNRNFHPRTFFVNSIQVAQPVDILNNIKTGTFNPKQIAYLEKDPGIKPEPVDSTAKAQITSYSIHNITIDVTASGNNLLFLSEVYYPAGWKAFIDGKETEIFKTNYLFRSVIVPKGQHKVEFRFEPETYYTGKKISMVSNIILIAIFVVAIGGIFIKRRKRGEKEEITS